MAHTKLDKIYLQSLVLLSILLYCQASVKLSDVSSDAFTKGHMKPLGSHRDPLPVTELTSIPAPNIFYSLYAKPGKPVILRGAAKSIPAYNLWTDEYLRYIFLSLIRS